MIKKSIKTKIKEYFFLNPTIKLRVRQIEREIEIPLPSAINYAKELEQEEFLKSEIIANIKIYSANRTSEKFLLEKKLFNIKYLISSGLINYLKIELSNPTIIIFGSFSRGEDIEKSDIDLYIESPTKKKINLSTFEKKIKKEIQIFIYRDINKIQNKNLANNIINGIVLNGFIEVFK
jgi:predicted nucleotidyltransferase